MNEKNVCLFPMNKQVSLFLPYRYHLYSYSGMESCSVGSILNLECGTGKNNSYFKIDIDELPLGQVELLRIRSKIDYFADVVDLCPRHKFQFIDNFSNTHRYKCADPFSLHKTLVKTNLHEVSLWEYNNFFACYDILPGQRVCMKCLKRAKDDDNDNTLKVYFLSFIQKEMSTSFFLVHTNMDPNSKHKRYNEHEALNIIMGMDSEKIGRIIPHR